MLKSLIRLVQTFSAAALIITASTGAYAENTQACKGAIKFAKGENQTYRESSIKGSGYCEYTFYAKAGQNLRAHLESKHSAVEAILYSPVDHSFSQEENFTLPKDGKYVLRVLQNRNAARKSNASKPFYLHIQIQ